MHRFMRQPRHLECVSSSRAMGLKMSSEVTSSPHSISESTAHHTSQVHLPPNTQHQHRPSAKTYIPRSNTTNHPRSSETLPSLPYIHRLNLPRTNGLPPNLTPPRRAPTAWRPPQHLPDKPTCQRRDHRAAGPRSLQYIPAASRGRARGANCARRIRYVRAADDVHAHGAELGTRDGRGSRRRWYVTRL